MQDHVKILHCTLAGMVCTTLRLQTVGLLMISEMEHSRSLRFQSQMLVIGTDIFWSVITLFLMFLNLYIDSLQKNLYIDMGEKKSAIKENWSSWQTGSEVHQ